MKRARFDSDEEARAYIEATLHGGIPSKDVWTLILANNPQLTIQDISRMCRVNTYFKELCDSGRIWDAIFRRQFGEEAFQIARQEMPQQLMLRLMTWRVWEDIKSRYHGRSVHTVLIMRKRNMRFRLLFRGNMRVMLFDNSGGPFMTPETEQRNAFLSLLKIAVPYAVSVFYTEAIAQFAFGALSPKQMRRFIFEFLQWGWTTPDRIEYAGCSICHQTPATHVCLGCGETYCEAHTKK